MAFHRLDTRAKHLFIRTKEKLLRKTESNYLFKSPKRVDGGRLLGLLEKCAVSDLQKSASELELSLLITTISNLKKRKKSGAEFGWKAHE